MAFLLSTVWLVLSDLLSLFHLQNYQLHWNYFKIVLNIILKTILQISYVFNV